MNVDHVIQALRTVGFETHIKKLTSELDLENEEKGKELIEDDQEMKDLINQQKKINKKKKRPIEFTEEMVNEQMKLFASADIMMSSGNGEELRVNGNKKMRIEGDQEELFQQDDKNEEVDFD